MIRANRATTRRAGFTLIELLVVIAIIAVLVSLTAAAVFKISGKADELVARHEISNLAAALEAFKTQMKVDWVPSRIRLRENLDDYITGIKNGDPLDAESWAFLKKVFPKITGTPYLPNPAQVPHWVDWNNNGQLDGAVDLEGHQCLIFFLGGIPDGPWNGHPNSVNGFATNPSNPAATTTDRIGPFYRDFKSDRLTAIATPPISAQLGSFTNGMQGPNGTPSAGFFSYLDPWGVNPYAYFSAYKKTNGYNRYLPYYTALGFASTQLPSAAGSDNHTLQLEARATLTTGIGDVWPYAQAGGTMPNPLMTYLNKDTYQIISSGPDKVFGEGTPPTTVNGVWTPLPLGSANALWSPQMANNQTPKGRDDFSNFHDRQLGSGD
jgi:prepilin-type N-terminal cleavage/methylation domain-containing protein